MLFPGTSLPAKKNPEYNLQELDKFTKKYRRFFNQPERTFDPLPSTPGRFVLESHLKRGIAWAEPVARRLNFFKAVADNLAALSMATFTDGRAGPQLVAMAGVENMVLDPATNVYRLTVNG